MNVRNHVFNLPKNYCCGLAALVLLLVHTPPVEAEDHYYTTVAPDGTKIVHRFKRRFSIKRFVGNVITAPLWITEETIRHACVAYCYSHIKCPHSPWTGIAAEAHREKILLDKHE